MVSASSVDWITDTLYLTLNSHWVIKPLHNHVAIATACYVNCAVAKYSCKYTLPDFDRFNGGKLHLLSRRFLDPSATLLMS